MFGRNHNALVFSALFVSIFVIIFLFWSVIVGARFFQTRRGENTLPHYQIENRFFTCEVIACFSNTISKQLSCVVSYGQKTICCFKFFFVLILAVQCTNYVLFVPDHHLLNSFFSFTRKEHLPMTNDYNFAFLFPFW